ncbi:MAG: hypothetical protein ACI4NV_08790 [Thermoguttaceae bacterium]
MTLKQSFVSRAQWTRALIFAAAALFCGSCVFSTNARAAESSWRTHAYSQTSEFALRLTLLEFTDKDDPKCVATSVLTDKMRLKNYPIQRVERSQNAEALFSLYRVETTPTFVLLLDGKEFGRAVVGQDDVSVTTKRLLRLFQRGRDAVAANPSAKALGKLVATRPAPTRGLLPPDVRAQVADGGASEGAAPEREIDYSVLDSRTEEISDLIGEERLERACARVLVENPEGGVERETAGVVIHYNSQYREALVAVAASPFKGIDEPALYPGVTLEVWNPLKGAIEKTGAQCVFCDQQTGVAYVAAQVSEAIKPAAFLPKNTPLNAGDRCFTALRNGSEVAKTPRDVLNVDFRRFFETSDGQSSYASYAIVTNPQAQGAPGAPVFVKRNGRYYVAGVLAATNEKGEGIVVPTTIMAQTLLSNRNLTTVYRDQIAGKFDAAATDAEIDSAIARLEILDREKAALQDSAPAQTPQYSLLTDDQSVAVALSEPTAAPDAFVELAAQNVDLANRVEVESALDGATGESSSSEEFPTSAKDAFARSEAAATALSDNAGFQFGEDAFPVANAFPRADESTLTQGTTPESAANARSSLALNDNFATPSAAPTLPEATAPLAPTPIPTPSAAPRDEFAQNAPSLDSKNQTPEQTAPVAQNNDALVASAAPMNETIRPTTFAPGYDPQTAEVFRLEEEQFEEALAALRRRGLEGAEIICIVNWGGEATGSRESEVVRLPRRTALKNPAASSVELARSPENVQPKAPSTVPQPNAATSQPTMTSQVPTNLIY